VEEDDMSVKWHVTMIVEVFATDVADAEKRAWNAIERADNLDGLKAECAGYDVTNIGVEGENTEDDTD
jgi:hypothetical protein